MGRSIWASLSAVHVLPWAGALLLVAVALQAVPSSPGPVDEAPGIVHPLPEPGGGPTAARLRSGVDPTGYARAIRQAEHVGVSPLSALQPWRDLGPEDPGGRVTDLAWDGSSLWVASASGGLWRTDREAEDLEPVWPDHLPAAIGAVAVLADGTIVVGTGEANAGGGSTTFAGDGLHLSTDGGESWEPVGLGASSTIARIVGHPTDPDVAWAAAGGSLYRPGGDRGIYRTADGGRTWAQTLPPVTPTTGGADIALDPANPDHLLAATWDRQRTPSLRRYGGVGSGLHRSTDGGLTWTPVTDGLPGFTEDSGRIAVAFSPADPEVVYAVVTRGTGRGDGLYRSDDGGRSFRPANSSARYLATQFIFGYWFSKVFPAPEDPDRVLIPGLDLAESGDGGGSLLLDGRVHADQHALVWDPEDPTQAWLGTDGGIYRSTDGGTTFSWTAARDQPFTQVYDAAAVPADPSQVAAGMQDNSCRRLTAGMWAPVAPCGDGTMVVTHPQTDEVIVCGQYARCWRTAGGATIALPRADLRRAAWSAPLVRLPGQPDRLLIGGDRLLRSDDDGASWSPISPDLTRGRSPDPDYAFGTITEILPLDGEGERIIVGTDDGLVQGTADGGETWEVLLEGDRWITGLAASPDAGALYASTSGFFSGEGTAQVRRSTDDGATWQDIARGLPDAPANDLLVVDDAGGASTLVVATDAGVYASADPRAVEPTWRRVGEDLPQAPAMSLDHVDGPSVLTVGTFGRGVWQTTLTSAVRHSGDDRYATAVTVGQASGGASAGGTVVLASGHSPADALAAGPLIAARPDWTLLLTEQDRLPAATAEALSARAPAELIVAGGPAVVADSVVAAAAAAAGDPPVRRISGADRVATAAALAAEHPTARTVLLATTSSPFDALAGAPLGAATDAVLLLTAPTRLPAATQEVLAALGPERVIVLGGTAAISDAVMGAAVDAAGTDPAVQRVAGVDRIQTAALVARLAAAEMSGADGDSRVWLASAAAVPDALAAAALGQPLMLTAPDSLSVMVSEALADLAPVDVMLAGGPAVLDEALLARLRGGQSLAAGATGP